MDTKVNSLIKQFEKLTSKFTLEKPKSAEKPKSITKAPAQIEKFHKSTSGKLVDIQENIEAFKWQIDKTNENATHLLIALLNLLIELSQIDADGANNIKRKKNFCFQEILKCKDELIEKLGQEKSWTAESEGIIFKTVCVPNLSSAPSQDDLNKSFGESFNKFFEEGLNKSCEDNLNGFTSEENIEENVNTTFGKGVNTSSTESLSKYEEEEGFVFPKVKLLAQKRGFVSHAQLNLQTPNNLPATGFNKQVSNDVQPESNVEEENKSCFGDEKSKTYLADDFKDEKLDLKVKELNAKEMLEDVIQESKSHVEEEENSNNDSHLRFKSIKNCTAFFEAKIRGENLPEHASKSTVTTLEPEADTILVPNSYQSTDEDFDDTTEHEISSNGILITRQNSAKVIWETKNEEWKWEEIKSQIEYYKAMLEDVNPDDAYRIETIEEALMEILKDLEAFGHKEQSETIKDVELMLGALKRIATNESNAIKYATSVEIQDTSSKIVEGVEVTLDGVKNVVDVVGNGLVDVVEDCNRVDHFEEEGFGNNLDFAEIEGNLNEDKKVGNVKTVFETVAVTANFETQTLEEFEVVAKDVKEGKSLELIGVEPIAIKESTSVLKTDEESKNILESVEEPKQSSEIIKNATTSSKLFETNSPIQSQNKPDTPYNVSDPIEEEEVNFFDANQDFDDIFNLDESETLKNAKLFDASLQLDNFCEKVARYKVLIEELDVAEEAKAAYLEENMAYVLHALTEIETNGDEGLGNRKNGIVEKLNDSRRMLANKIK